MPRRWRSRPALCVVVAGVVAATALAFAVPWTSSAARHRASTTMPSAVTDAGLPQVGPLFPKGLTGSHTCTASVVASGSGDTVLTAAHCLAGTVRGMLFVPAYRSGRMPYGAWTVTAAFVTDAWRTRQDPADDVAVLTVADRTIDGRRRSLASVTGSERIARTPRAGTAIRIEAYNAGSGDSARTCTAALQLVRGFPTFYCHGFVGGSSGSPWLLARAGTPTVAGVIGGRHQGGCSEHTSHSSVFGADVPALVARAARGGAGDRPPVAGSDNCPASASG